MGIENNSNVTETLTICISKRIYVVHIAFDSARSSVEQVQPEAAKLPARDLIRDRTHDSIIVTDGAIVCVDNVLNAHEHSKDGDELTSFLGRSSVLCDQMESVAANNSQTLNVSLEDHLVDVLRPLLTLLPTPLAVQLTPLLSTTSSLQSTGACTSRTIPYALLDAISRWARSPDGESALRAHVSPLSPQDYTMIALLAGARTSPERKFPAIMGKQSLGLDHDLKKELSDRRAVTAVINALLSIGGSGVATWWAAERLGWRDEWKVLLALCVAIVVAASEGALYVIWSSRPSHRRPLAFGGGPSPPSLHLSKRTDETDGDSASANSMPADALPETISAATTAHSQTDRSAGLRERTSVATHAHKG
ncbi:hypothetical protein A0H81_05857 [Grifola frondosa]|uniref:Uncharacterized protein n=1 Tax=Grifola frondosa TaxID=5627 RepID=A0A1C7MBC7_GRIFR|nr:hypothetical protein A0H81_05857 [Grifola frondosa]